MKWYDNDGSTRVTGFISSLLQANHWQRRKYYTQSTHGRKTMLFYCKSYPLKFHRYTLSELEQGFPVVLTNDCRSNFTDQQFPVKLAVLSRIAQQTASRQPIPSSRPPAPQTTHKPFPPRLCGIWQWNTVSHSVWPSKVTTTANSVRRQVASQPVILNLNGTSPHKCSPVNSCTFFFIKCREVYGKELFVVQEASMTNHEPNAVMVTHLQRLLVNQQFDCLQDVSQYRFIGSMYIYI